jgi:hypothetical protein
VPIPLSFQIIAILFVLGLATGLFTAIIIWPPSKGAVLNALFRKRRALTCGEIAKELNPFRPQEEKVREHLTKLIRDGDVKRIGNAYRITEDANARLREEVTDMPPITLDNMP